MSVPALFCLALSFAFCGGACAVQHNVSSTSNESSVAASSMDNGGKCEDILTQCLQDIDANKSTDCPLLPYVSSEVRNPPPIAPGYTLQAVRPGLWAYWDGAYFSLIIQGPKILAIVDAPRSQGSTKTNGSGTRVTDAVQEILAGSRIPPTEIHFWYSHPHGDHIGSIPLAYKFLANIYPSSKLRVFAPEIAFPGLASFRTIDLPKVTDIVVQNHTYSYGEDLDFEVHVLNGHTNADLALYFAPTKNYSGFVYTVDLVFPGAAPFFNLGYTRDVAGYIASHLKLLSLDFDQLVAGHLYRLGTRKDVQDNLRYVQDVLLASEEANKDILAADVIAKQAPGLSVPGAIEYGNTWYAFGVYLKALENRCYRTIVEKYGCRLAAVDVTARSVCSVAIAYVRLSL